MTHPLVDVLARAAVGEFPPADGATEILPPDADGTLAVVAFTGHAYVLADTDEGELAARQTDDAAGGFGGALAPGVLTWLAGDAREVGSLDVVMMAEPEPRQTIGVVRRRDLDTHGRVVRARRHRRDVAVYADDDGMVIVGRGLVGRWEISVELFDPAAAANGAGRRLIAAGRHHVPLNERCWAQVAPGNARSLRAFLAAGFVPVCSEVLITESDGDLGPRGDRVPAADIEPGDDAPN